MTEMLSTIFITAVFAFFPGLLFGYVWAKRNQKPLIQKAYDRAKEEFDAERVELSDDLGAQLSKIRHSIIQSVEAYESAARVVEEKCLKNIKGHVAIEAPREEQRQIDFFKNEASSKTGEKSSTGESEELFEEDEPIKKNYTENALKDNHPENNLKKNELENSKELGADKKSFESESKDKDRKDTQDAQNTLETDWERPDKEQRSKETFGSSTPAP